MRVIDVLQAAMELLMPWPLFGLRVLVRAIKCTPRIMCSPNLQKCDPALQMKG